MQRMAARLRKFALLLVLPVGAHAIPTTLDFEALLPQPNATQFTYNNVLIGNFYGGGSGPNLGVTFTNGFASRSRATGGDANFGPRSLASDSSPLDTLLGNSALFLFDGGATGAPVTITFSLATGFDGTFSFYYAASDSLSVQLGSQSAVSFALTPTGGGPNIYDRWALANVVVSSLVTTVSFSGTNGRAFIDNITFSSTSTSPPGGLPEPGSLALVAVALAGLGVASRRRRT